MHLRDYLLPYSVLSPYQLFEFNLIHTLNFVTTRIKMKNTYTQNGPFIINLKGVDII